MASLCRLGVMVVTRVDRDHPVTPRYLNTICRRFEQRDMQARIARKVTAALYTKAYIVLFRENCGEFWVYNLADRRGWHHFDSAQMELFLKRLEK